jgi:hypothetical protein
MSTQENKSEGVVYLVHAIGTDRIKVGHTFSLKRRLQQLQTSSPFPLQLLACWPGSAETELRIHALLSDYRKVGEWFEVPPFIGRRILAEIKKGCTKPAASQATDQPRVRSRRSPQANLYDPKLWRELAASPPMPRSFTCVPHLSAIMKSVQVIEGKAQITTETVTGWQIQVRVTCAKCGGRYRPVAGFISPRVFAHLRRDSFNRQCEVVRHAIESRLLSRPINEHCPSCLS